MKCCEPAVTSAQGFASMLRSQSELGPTPFTTTTSGPSLSVLDDFAKGLTPETRAAADMSQQ